MDKNNKQLKVALYLRVSTDDQVERYGLDLQEDALRAMVSSRGRLNDGRPAMVISEDHIYRDEGISGTTEINERPGFAKLKEDILLSQDNPPFDVVAVYKIDRFARRLKILLEVIDLFEEYKVKFVSVNESIDTSTPFGKAILGIIGIIAELEIETTKLRTQAGRKAAIKAGTFMGSAAPYGYRKNEQKHLEVFDKEAEVIRNIYDMLIIDNFGTQQIADYLREHKILSPDASAVYHNKRKGTSKKKNDPFLWRAEKVRKILQDEIYIGKYYYHKYKSNKHLPKSEWKLSPYSHAPIIGDFEFQKAQKILDQQKVESRSKRAADDHLYLLSGLLKCEACYSGFLHDDRMTWTGGRKNIGKNKYSYYYQCGRKNRRKFSDPCTTIPIPAKQLEEFVVSFAKNLLSDPKAAYRHYKSLKSTKLNEAHLRKQLEQLTESLESIPRRENNLKSQHEMGLISDDELREKIRELKNSKKGFSEKIKEVQYRLGEQTIAKGYEKTFELFSEEYASKLDETFKDRKKTYDLLHVLISNIYVWSRPVTDDDSIAGRKRDDQMIPDRIEIELRLPQDMIKDLALQPRFGAKNDAL